jgi:hypothetical protein
MWLAVTACVIRCYGVGLDWAASIVPGIIIIFLLTDVMCWALLLVPSRINYLVNCLAVQ